MLEIILFVFVLVLAPVQDSNKPADSESAPDLEVRKFSWSRYHRDPLETERVDNKSGETRPRKLDDGMENRDSLMEKRNSVEIQSRAMKDYEESVGRESRQPNPNVFRYSVQVKNTGTTVISGIYFDYQVVDPSDPEILSHRQFACDLKLKPNGTQQLEAFTVSPPNRIVSATPKTTLTEKVLINRIDYSDNRFWQRTGWQRPNDPTAVANLDNRCRLL
jgi:hypothetical protein